MAYFKWIILLLLVTFALPYGSRAQDDDSAVVTDAGNTTDPTDLKVVEDSLVNIAHKMFTGMMPGEKLDSGIAFGKLLYKTIKDNPESFKYGFDSLAKVINIIYSEDKSFRIFNWLVVPDPGIVRYYGIIQTSEGTFPLINQSDKLMDSKTVTSDQLSRKNWFGAEYYRILDKKVKGQNYYFLLGLNRDGDYANKKILDVLYFTEDGPVFGAPLIYFPDDQDQMVTQTRVIWQYQQDAPFYLDYNTDKKMITFDELRSRINNPLRKNTYVPTGQIDGLKWEDDRWVFKSNVITPLKLKDGQAPVNGVIPKGN